MLLNGFVPNPLYSGTPEMFRIATYPEFTNVDTSWAVSSAVGPEIRVTFKFNGLDSESVRGTVPPHWYCCVPAS